MPYIDIKSEGLHDMKALSLMEDKLSVIEIEYYFQEERLRGFRWSKMSCSISYQSSTNMRKM